MVTTPDPHLQEIAERADPALREIYVLAAIDHEALRERYILGGPSLLFRTVLAQHAALRQCLAEIEAGKARIAERDARIAALDALVKARRIWMPDAHGFLTHAADQAEMDAALAWAAGVAK